MQRRARTGGRFGCDFLKLLWLGLQALERAIYLSAQRLDLHLVLTELIDQAGDPASSVGRTDTHTLVKVLLLEHSHLLFDGPQVFLNTRKLLLDIPNGVTDRERATLL